MPTIINAYPPSESESEELFKADDWDYKVGHNSVPILKDPKRNHTLPPTANETVSRYKRIGFLFFLQNL